jgi:hypothetical protein
MRTCHFLTIDYMIAMHGHLYYLVLDGGGGVQLR